MRSPPRENSRQDGSRKTKRPARNKYRVPSYTFLGEHTINNLDTSSENLTAAESRIRDVDMAKEMMEFTKNNILSQASQAMLSQLRKRDSFQVQALPLLYKGKFFLNYVHYLQGLCKTALKNRNRPYPISANDFSSSVN